MGYKLSETSVCGHTLYFTDVILGTIGLIFLILRFWSAHLSRRWRIYADDVLVSAGFVITLALMGTANWAVLNGLGQPILKLTTEDFIAQVKFLMISEYSYLLATTLIKSSVLWLYNRIYDTAQFRPWCYAVLAFDCLYLIAFMPVYATNCKPVHEPPWVICRDLLGVDVATITVNLALDIFILVLPMPVLWRLQMSSRDKMTITAMFSIGILTVAVMIWRLVVTIQTRESPDWPETMCQVQLISVIELFSGTVAACIPTLGPLFNRRIKPTLQKLSFIGSFSGGSKGSSGSSSDKTTRGSFQLRTFGGSPMRHFGGFDSQDRIVVAEEVELRTSPRKEGVVTSECAFKPFDRNDEPRPPAGVIHVRRDIEALYSPDNGEFS